jgi:hypothetical protein
MISSTLEDYLASFSSKIIIYLNTLNINYWGEDFKRFLNTTGLGTYEFIDSG